MADKKSKLTIEDYKSDFTFKKKENGLKLYLSQKRLKTNQYTDLFNGNIFLQKEIKLVFTIISNL